MTKKFEKKQLYKVIVLFTFFSLFLFNSVSFSKAEGELTLWYFEDENLDDTLLSLIDTYETENSVTITAINKSFDDLRDEYKIKYDDENPPDLILGPSEWIAELALLGSIEPLNDSLIEAGGYLDKALFAVQYYDVDSETNAVSNDVSYYGFPQRADVAAFLYNVDEFGEEVPDFGGSWSTEQFKDALVAANDQSNPDPLLKQYGFAYLDNYYGPEAIFNGAGGEFFSEYTVDGDHFMIETNESIDAMTYVYDLTHTYRVSVPFDAENLEKLGISGFASDGNISSVIGMASNLKEIYDGSLFDDPTKLGIAPLPVDSKANAGFLSVNAFMINSMSNNKEDAIALAKYLTSEESMVENAKTEYLLPTVVSAYDNTEISDLPFVKAFKTLIDDASLMPISQYTTEFRSIKMEQFSFMLLGNQYAPNTCLGLKLKLSPLIPKTTSIAPIKYGDSPSGIPGYSPLMTLGLLGVISSLLVFLKKRSEK